MLFHTYSQFSTVPNLPPKPTEEERETEEKLQEILEKVSWERHAETKPAPRGGRPRDCRTDGLADTGHGQRDGVIGQLTRLLESESTLTA